MNKIRRDFYFTHLITHCLVPYPLLLVFLKSSKKFSNIEIKSSYKCLKGGMESGLFWKKFAELFPEA
jgi:hypothetical protein